ncbi:hypothetical protein Pcinc_027400 [Petrolisthes cinctipes]|uniref:RRM domain-containing protein n=1 Tax=Petrolisthes cinctipes TaxID=88211 RepID=A0AAE1F568_PETCI|nr:hypothetical protein Pcinc_027400 [Petrolisthes cinctipes]
MALHENKSRGVIASNFDESVNKRQVLDLFDEIGPIQRCNLVRDKEGVFKGIAYISFETPEDAERAVTSLNSTTFNGSQIIVKLSQQRKNERPNTKPDDAAKTNEKQPRGWDWNVKVEEGQLDDDKTNEKQPRGWNWNVKVEEGQLDDDKPFNNKKKRRARRNRCRTRRGKDCCIIVRNLSFEVTDQLVEDHFAQCGKVRRVSLLKKEDGSMKGCGFVHFNNKSGALNAIKECNMKPLLGRPIAVDLFVPKSEYDPANVKQEIKEECDDDDDVEDDENDGDDTDDDKDSGDSGVDDDDDDDDSDDDEEKKPPEKSKPQKEPSKDVSEGRTLFIKNLSFIATEEDISEVLARFGEVKSINLCMDRDTGHPRGTAFAQYQNRESADACLAAEADTFTKSDFILHGRPMYIMRAVSRKELDTKKSDKTKSKVKDKRNLYLAREGFVRQGTKAAEGMSKADLLFRMRREQVKRQTLKNLHIFLSKIRLCVFNLPQEVDSKKLKDVLEKYSPKEAKITECRIMKNLMDLDESGQAKSRGWGFVSFTEHDHALHALRSVNNNPEIFDKNQRPVVEFSMENLVMVRARERRMEKSRDMNPNYKNNKLNTNNDESTTPKAEQIMKSDTESGPSFMGAKYNPDNKKLPKHLGPKNRYRDRAKGKITRNKYRREKREQKQGKKRKSPQQGNEDGLPPKKKARKGGNKSQDMNTTKKGKKKSKKSQFGRDLKVKKKPKKFKKLRQ